LVQIGVGAGVERHNVRTGGSAWEMAMDNKNELTRRELALLGANMGVATFAAGTLGLPGRAEAQEAKAMLGHFPSANQQNFAKATGSMQKALGEKTKLEFIGVSAGPQILTAMAANSMDLCNIGSSAMIVGMVQGLPVSMVYLHKIVKDSECLVVRTDAGIKRVADLKGKKVGCPFNTSVHFAVLAAMKSAGLTASDVTLVNLRPDAIAAAWQRKEIDAAYIWYPVLGVLEKDGGEIIFMTGDLAAGGTLIFDAIVCRDAFKKEHPQLVLAYLKELDRINEIYRSKPEQVADVLAPFLQLSREAVLTACKTTHTLTPRDMLATTWMGPPGAKDSGILKAIRDQADFLKSTDQVKSVPADFSALVDSSFVAKMV
jgi:taurine transport system substrate-binding protein